MIRYFRLTDIVIDDLRNNHRQGQRIISHMYNFNFNSCNKSLLLLFRREKEFW